MQTYPPIDNEEDYVSPLEIVSRNWTPGTAGFRLSEQESEFAKVVSRSPISLPNAQGHLIAALGFLRSYAAVDPRYTQVLIQCETRVYTGSGSSGTPVTIGYPYSFPNETWIVIPVFGDSPGWSLWRVGSADKNGFQFYSSASTAFRVNYIAIGY